MSGLHSHAGAWERENEKFPYSIYYDVKGEDIYVIAGLAEKRNPNWINEKIKKKANNSL